MTTEGTVRVWRDDEGWGVIDTAQTPGGCWTHFSSVHMSGYRTLHAGEGVLVDWEAADQDGYAFRTVRTWPADEQAIDPVSRTGDPNSSAYSSSLTITWEDGTTTTS
jgi:CspA family cold shock protein